MGLAFIPIYIKYLGIEAYGLIGLFALLQAWLGLLDMGMTPTLGREMARFTGGSQSIQSIRDLLRSIEIIAFGVALLIGIGIAFSANWIATSWLQAGALSIETISHAFIVMGVVTALRFVESIYRSCILGLQRQVLFNIVNSTMATIRAIGSVLVLAWVSPSIEAFFVWQGAVSIATLTVLLAATYSSLPRAGRSGRFSVEALKRVWRFAGSMLGITFLALLLTQIDKLLLSTILPLEEYGNYVFASIVAGALYMIVAPITQAYYPRLCEAHARGDKAGLVVSYHAGAQIITVFSGSFAITLILFSETILKLWTKNHQISIDAAPLLSLLVLGNFLNGLMHLPYSVRIAYGKTSLIIWVNLIAISLIVPGIFFITPQYGAVGAAVIWVALNVGYVFIGTHFMMYAVLDSEKWRWYIIDVSIPLASGLAVCGSISLFSRVTEDFFHDPYTVLLALVMTFLAASASAPLARAKMKILVLALVRRWGIGDDL